MHDPRPDAHEASAAVADQPRNPDVAHHAALQIAQTIADTPKPHFPDWPITENASPRYTTNGLLNACYFKALVADIESWHSLTLYLRQNRRVAETLGLDSVPNHDTIRRFWEERAGRRDILDDEIEALEQELRDLGVPPIERELPAPPEPDYPYPPDSPAALEQAEKDRAYQRVAPILHDVIDFDRAPNARVEHESLVDFAAYLCRRNQYAEQGAELYRTEEGPDAMPYSPETFRRAVRLKERKKTETKDGDTKWCEPVDWSVQPFNEHNGTDEWHSEMEAGIEQLVAELKEEDVIDGPVPVCIDGSVRPWHKHPDGADDRPDGVYQEAYFDTNYGWKDISASAIIDGRTIVLANISMVPGDKFFQAVKYLIDRATELVNVECFHADAEFANTDICRYIDHVGEEYVMKKPHRNRVKRYLEDFTGKADYAEFEMRSTTKGRRGGAMTHNTNLFAVEKRGKIGVKPGVKRDEDTTQTGLEDFGGRQADGQLTLDDLGGEDDDIEYVAFITNQTIESVGIDPAEKPVAHDNEKTVWGCAERYRRRWSIETAFRQLKYQFMAKTRSRDLGVRRFYWMVGILLYNAWATMNLLVQAWVPHVDGEEPPVPSKVFLERLAEKRPPPD